MDKLEQERQLLLKEHEVLEKEFFSLRSHMIQFKNKVIEWANKHREANPGMTNEDVDKLIEHWNEFSLEEDEELEERKKGGKDWHATGKKKGQKGAKDKDTDYSGKGMRKGDKSDTDPGATDFSGKGMRKGDKSDTDPGREDDTWRKGKKSKTHKGLNKENLMREDSGEEEGHHYDDNRMSDDDHIKAIEHHLEALKKDRDYDDDHIDEKKDLSEAQVRALIRKALKEVAKSKGK